MTTPVISAASAVLAHVPGLCRHGSKPSRELPKNPEVEAAFLGALRTFEQAVAYAPHQAFLGAIHPRDLPERPWVGADGERRGPLRRRRRAHARGRVPRPAGGGRRLRPRPAEHAGGRRDHRELQAPSARRALRSREGGGRGRRRRSGGGGARGDEAAPGRRSPGRSRAPRPRERCRPDRGRVLREPREQGERHAGAPARPAGQRHRPRLDRLRHRLRRGGDRRPLPARRRQPRQVGGGGRGLRQRLGL